MHQVIIAYTGSVKMDLTVTETNKGKPCLIRDGFTYRINNTLKNGEITWRCTENKHKCSAKLRTDGDKKSVLSVIGEHNHEPSTERNIEKRILRNQVKRKACEDMCARPSKIIRTELRSIQEESLQAPDLKSVRQAMYRERRKLQPKLPSSRIETIEALGSMQPILTSKEEQFLLVNDSESEIVIFSCTNNLQILSNVPEIYADGTFKCSPKFFTQLYTIHGYQNGLYVPLVYSLLPSKTEACYTKMLTLLCECLSDRGLVLHPQRISLDFEVSALNAFKAVFPDSTISGCLFHLGQSWFRKIQKLGLATEYKDPQSVVGRWLSQFFGLSFLHPDSVADSFVEDLMANTPTDPKCTDFADYVVENYIDDEAPFPPKLWAEIPSDNRRTNNGCEAFHHHFNEQFYRHSPNIFMLVDVLLKLQSTTYVKIRSLGNIVHQTRRDREKQAFLHQQQERYNNGQINRSQFVTSVGYRFRAKPGVH